MKPKRFVVEIFVIILLTLDALMVGFGMGTVRAIRAAPTMEYVFVAPEQTMRSDYAMIDAGNLPALTTINLSVAAEVKPLPFPYSGCQLTSYGHQVHVLPIFVGNASVNESWDLDRVLESFFDRDFRIETPMRAESVQDVIDIDRYTSDIVLVAFTDEVYRGDHWNPVWGYMCGSVGHVSLHPTVGCPLVVFAHEVGHALGRDHESSGVMRNPIDCGQSVAFNPVQKSSQPERVE